MSVLLIAAAGVVFSIIASGVKWALSQTSAARGSRGFNGASYLAVDPGGNLYVSDRENLRVAKLSSTGTLIGSWHEFPGIVGTDHGPGPLAIDPRGNVYVASAGKVQEFSPTGRRLAQWALGFDPQGIAIDSQGKIYLVDSDTAHIVVYSPMGARLAVWKTRGSGPHGIAIDGRGTIYVADSGSDRIEKRSSTGRLLAMWGGRGRGLGQFDNPESLAVDGSGTLYVGDSGNHRIQMLSPQDKVLGWWGSWGTGRGQFSEVTTLFVAIDKKQDLVYVADMTADAIHKFAWNGRELAVWR